VRAINAIRRFEPDQHFFAAAFFKDKGKSKSKHASPSDKAGARVINGSRLPCHFHASPL
jgi:hypothetical protein